MTEHTGAQVTGKEGLGSLIPNLSRHPYYIFAPRYVQHSAGVRVLHLLCHWLNRLGERAFIVSWQDGHLTNPNLLTPLLTSQLVALHAAQGCMPIVVYPEITRGNPLNADCVVRYVLNVPGLLGGDRIYPPGEMVWAYAKQLADLCARCDGVLHMPVIDQNVFFPMDGRVRKGALFYAAKFQSVHGQKVFGLPDGAIEITRGQPDSQTPAEIASLLQSAEAFYCFENTALATEAVLCGCPAVFMPNPYLDKPIALNELGWDGYAWGNDPAEVDRARRTVSLAQVNYGRTVETFFEQVRQFVRATQTRAEEVARNRENDTSNTSMDQVLVVSGTSVSLFNSRQVAADIRKRKSLRFHEWWRVVRALNLIALRSMLGAFKRK